MDTNKQEPTKSFDPLISIWKVVTNVGGVVGLVSFSRDVVDWISYIEVLGEYYRLIVHWPWKWFDVADWVKDYVFFGVLFAGSSNKGGMVSNNLLFFIFTIIIWPFLMVLTVLIFINRDAKLSKSELSDTNYWSFKRPHPNDVKSAKHFVRWYLAVIIGFFALLILSTVLKYL